MLLWEDLLSHKRTAYTIDKRYLTKKGTLVEHQLTVFRARDTILNLIAPGPLVVDRAASCVVAGGSDSDIVVHHPGPHVAVLSCTESTIS